MPPQFASQQVGRGNFRALLALNRAAHSFSGGRCWQLRVAASLNRSDVHPLANTTKRCGRARFSKQPLQPARGARLIARAESEANLLGIGMDFLTFLGTTVLVAPIAKRLNISPVLGFLASGFVLQQLGMLQDLQDMEKLSEFGVLFLLFEMGLELSLDRLKALAKYAFGMGTLQMVLTTGIFSAFSLPPSYGTLFLEKFANATPSLVSIHNMDEAVVIGAALSMSSSAFVLQLLRERGELQLRFGAAVLGILLFQDIAVVPFLVLLPLIEGHQGDMDVSGMSPVSLVGQLGPVALQTIAGLGLLLVGGRVILRRIFQFVAESRNSEAFVALCLLTVASSSLLTKSLGLSDTLGAFIAGVLLSESSYKTQVEADISPFRGLLLGLFFVTTGSSINVGVLLREWPSILWILAGLLVIKTTILMAVARPFGLTRSESIRTGFLLSQSGEFAFVLLSLANSLQVLPTDLNQLLIIVVVLSMALTPVLAEMGKVAAEKLEELLGDSTSSKGGRDMDDPFREDTRDLAVMAGNPVVILGFGPTSQMVVNMLESPLAVPTNTGTAGPIPYIVFDLDPSRVLASRQAGLKVIFGDGSRSSVLHAAGVTKPRAVVVNHTNKSRSVKAVHALSLAYPDVDILASAADFAHAAELQQAGATCVMVASITTGMDLGTNLLGRLGVAERESQFVRRGVDEAVAKRTRELAARLKTMERTSALLGFDSASNVFVVDVPAHTKFLLRKGKRDTIAISAEAVQSLDSVVGSWDGESGYRRVNVDAVTVTARAGSSSSGGSMGISMEEDLDDLAGSPAGRATNAGASAKSLVSDVGGVVASNANLAGSSGIVAGGSSDSPGAGHEGKTSSGTGHLNGHTVALEVGSEVVLNASPPAKGPVPDEESARSK